MSAVTAVVRPLPQPEPPKEVVLTMPVRTAEILAAIAGGIAGDPDTTYRGRMDEVYCALESAGIHSRGIGRYFRFSSLGMVAKERAE
ncbi:MAG TPA: hypothetical protein VFI41_12580 [Gemmatimonadales bacterium]|nr:hypothetical protein [Gemmatimonadales bacterium]